ncbi:MAG: SNF2-related protein [Acidimicrobiales bacterium]
MTIISDGPTTDEPQLPFVDDAVTPVPAPSDAPRGLTEFNDLVDRHLDGDASPPVLRALESERPRWIERLYWLLDELDDQIDRLGNRLSGAERRLVVNDLQREAEEVDAVLTSLVGPPSGAKPATPTPAAPAPDPEPEGEAALQLSWLPGRIVAFGGGINAPNDDTEGVLARLAEAGASPEDWEPFQSIKLPNGQKADTVVASTEAVLGWLLDLTRPADDDAPALGAGAVWLGHAASVAVGLVAQGRMVPQLRKARRSRTDGSHDGPSYQVSWQPALVDADGLASLSSCLPHSVTALGHRPDARSATINILGDLIEVLCTTATARLDVAAPPPQIRNKSDVAEAFLAHLDGEPFPAPSRAANDVARRLDQWARPVTAAQKFALVVQLDPPDADDTWYLKVLAPTPDGQLEPVEAGLVTASNTRRKEVRDHLTRLERLFPPLLRPGAARRGEVILSQDEAWTLMTVAGPILETAGFDVRVPNLSRKKPAPSLRLTSDTDETAVGAQQLANVRWSAVFGDVELTAEEIQRLAAQARPLVQSNGAWVELDQADLAKAAAALADRADTKQLTGAEMLRHALGLDGTPFDGGISIAGSGWAADLLASARTIPDQLPTTPDGFRGELRSYQADALAWLGFLDTAGLGGCLALDMGLGKTPTMLAHLGLTAGEAPSLVIAPPAVVGNWASEARKFVPGLRVRVHHGPNRAQGRDAIERMAAGTDVIITTYGTAVRDMNELGRISWGRVVLDEAQAIKNPASETAQSLRRLEAHSKVALTGTPIENGLGDLWAILDWANPGLVGSRNSFVSQLSVRRNGDRKAVAESALKALNGILVFRRTKAEPAIAAELPDRIDELDHCAMTPEQIGLYQAVLDDLVKATAEGDDTPRQKGAVLAAITALKQICNHPVNYRDDDPDAEVQGLEGRSGKLARVNEIVDHVFAADEKVLIFTHFASWGEKLADYLSERTGVPVGCYHGGLARGARDRMVDEFQEREGKGAMVLSLKAGGTGLNLTAANHVVLYDRWWNPAVEDQARDRVWRIGQKNKVVCHRLVCPGTVDERVEEVVAGKRQIADLVLPKSSSVEDLDSAQIQAALGLDDAILIADDEITAPKPTTAATTTEDVA